MHVQYGSTGWQTRIRGRSPDVNLSHGRAHEGEVHLEGMQLQSPEHAGAQNAKASAYVRPHDLDVQRHSPGQGLDENGRSRGIVVRLERARFLRNNSGRWDSSRARRWW